MAACGVAEEADATAPVHLVPCNIRQVGAAQGNAIAFALCFPSAHPACFDLVMDIRLTLNLPSEFRLLGFYLCQMRNGMCLSPPESPHLGAAMWFYRLRLRTGMIRFSGRLSWL